MQGVNKCLATMTVAMMTKSFSVSESFARRADSACFYEAWVASVLARAGLWTIHHPFTLAKSSESFAAMGQSWDLDVSKNQPGPILSLPGVSVEVKSLSNSFHNPSDYPYQSVLVCSQKSFIKKWPGRDRIGRDFLFASRDTGAILWLPKGSPVTLGNEVYDKGRGELYLTVTSDKSLLLGLSHFIEMVYEKT